MMGYEFGDMGIGELGYRESGGVGDLGIGGLWDLWIEGLGDIGALGD